LGAKERLSPVYPCLLFAQQEDFMKRIAVLTSGGDAPGMNAAVRAVVRTAAANDMSVIGFKRGYNGVLMQNQNAEDDFVLMTARKVSGIVHRGGTVLMTARCKEFLQPKYQQIAIDNMKVYRAMLEAVMPWFCDTTGKLPPPLAADELLEPELAAIAARRSWQRNGERVLISDLRMDDDGYDGYAFARGYRRARLQADGTLLSSALKKPLGTGFISIGGRFAVRTDGTVASFTVNIEGTENWNLIK
jgi:hypothetical protein